MLFEPIPSEGGTRREYLGQISLTPQTAFKDGSSVTVSVYL